MDTSEPIIPVRVRPVEYNATLTQGLRRCRGLVRVEGDVHLILDTSAVHCVWSGTPRFDAWFRTAYGTVDIQMDADAVREEIAA